MSEKPLERNWYTNQVKFWNERATSSKGTGLVPFRELEFDFVSTWTAGNNVLDAGCGKGEIMDWISSLHIEVEGIDLSPEMVKIAQRRHPKVHVMDLAKLTFEDGAFDTVLAVRVIKNILDEAIQESALKELGRVARRRVIIVDSIAESKVISPPYNLYLSRDKIARVFRTEGYCLKWEEFFRIKWLAWPLIASSRTPQLGSDEGFFVFDRGDLGVKHACFWRYRELKLSVRSAVRLFKLLGKRLFSK